MSARRRSRRLSALLTTLVLGISAPTASERVSRTDVASERTSRTDLASERTSRADVAGELGERLDAYAALWSGDGSVDMFALAPFFAERSALPSFGAFTDEALDASAVSWTGRLELDPDATSIRMRRVGDVSVQKLGGVVATASRFRFEADYPRDGTVAVPLRHTALWERGADGWRMLHEHLSAPLDAVAEAAGASR